MTADGAIIEDVMEAQNRDSVVSKLRDAQQLPISVIAADTRDGALAGAGASKSNASRENKWRGNKWRGKKIPPEALTIFTRQLATLLDAGLSLPDALSVAIDAAENDRVRAIAAKLHQAIRDGASLSDAMSQSPEYFDSFYHAMVRAGENGGALAEGLNLLGGYMERAARLKSDIQTALLYPTILMSTAFVSVAILLTIVLPQFEALFRSAASDLPALTKTVFAFAGFIRDQGLILLIGLVLAFFAGRFYLLKSGGRRRLDQVVLRLPLLGPLIQMIEFERIFRSLAALIGNGVGLSQALEHGVAVARNRVVATALAEINDAVKAGESLADAVARQPVVPALARHLVRVGEAGGALQPMLLKLSTIYAGELEVRLKRLVVVIEPALILLIGLFVAIIVISLLSAIVGINAITL